MGILEKFKNLFTEEIEEENVPVKREPVVPKRETRTVEPIVPKRTERTETVIERANDILVETEEPVKEEKFVFPVYFDDKDFDDLKKPEPKIEKKEPIKEPIKVKEPYQGAKPQIVVESKKNFTPSPIISPVYGILDKNYKKEDIGKREKPKVEYHRRTERLTVDDIRNKAFGTLEDDLETNLFETNSEPVMEPIIDDTKEALNLLQELNFEEQDILVKEQEEQFERAEREFLNMDTTDEENEENDLLDQNFEDTEIVEPVKIDHDYDTDTAELARQLEEQKRKLEEINQFINESKLVEEKEETREERLNQSESPSDEDTEEALNESDLFNLIDSMYEQKEDE